MAHRHTLLMPIALILVIAAAVSGLAHLRNQPSSGIHLFHAV